MHPKDLGNGLQQRPNPTVTTPSPPGTALRQCATASPAPSASRPVGWGLGAAHGGLGSEGRPGEAEGKKRSSLRECTNECPLAPRHYLLDRARWTITIHYRTSQQLTSRPDPTSRTPRWAPGAAALSPAPHGKRGIGAARSQSPGSAFSSESFRKPCWG